MISREEYLALDSRQPHYAKPAGRSYSDKTTERVQKEFHHRNRKATTNICSVVGIILAARMCFFLDNWLMFAVILLGVATCMAIYKAFCDCPNCDAPLGFCTDNGVRGAAGFSTEICPRCDIKLIDKNAKYIPIHH